MNNNVQFEEEPTLVRRSVAEPGSRGITGFLIQKGVVKSVQAANMLFIGVVVVAVILIGILNATRGEDTPPPQIDPDMLI